jgi:hypothetical protein
VNGLYVLLLETDKVMDETMLEDLEKTLILLMKMEIESTLGNTLASTFGKWYLFILVSLFLFTHYHCFAP